MSHSLEFYSELADHLLTLQAALHQADLWESPQPSEQQLASTQPFAVDTMAFEQWLRYVFIARFKSMIEARQTMPSNCNIAPMVESSFSTLSSSDQSSIQSALEAIDQHLSGTM